MHDVDTKRFGALPTAAGWITRLAYTRVRRAGIELKPLLKKAGLTDQHIKDRGARFPVHHQIQFLNLAANVLRDDFLGFHLAQLPDLRELELRASSFSSTDEPRRVPVGGRERNCSAAAAREGARVGDRRETRLEPANFGAPARIGGRYVFGSS